MDEIGLEEVKRRSVGGIITLTSRTFILQAISFLTTFLLTIFLAPSVFGVFFIVSAVISFLAYFSDIGLAAALIQKKEAITQDDLKTTFTIQQFLVGTIVILALVFSRTFAVFYNLDSAGLWLLRALLISFFLSSLKTIPSVLLERRLEFNRLVIPQIVETFLFSLVAVLLAIKGFGVASFTWAVLARGISGLLVIYILSPWRVSFGFSKEVASRLLSFGFPFQANSILALIKDDLLIIFLGKILPFSAVGYLGWAKKWAEFPLRLVMDNVIKVTFPAYARLQDNKEFIGKAIEKSIFFVSVIIFPLTLLMIFAIKPLVFVIPKYTKWEPALLPFYLFAASSIFASISTPLTNVLNATGKIKTTLKLMVLWTVLTWVLTPILIYFCDFTGVALVALLVSTTVFLPVLLVKRIVDFTFIGNVGKPFLAATMMGITLYLIMPQLQKDLLGLVVMVTLGVIIYSVAMFILAKEKILESLNLFLRVLKHE